MVLTLQKNATSLLLGNVILSKPDNLIGIVYNNLLVLITPAVIKHPCSASDEEETDK